MRKYENDSELKIPSWYLKLPEWVLNVIIAVCDMTNKIFHRKQNSKLENCSTKFNI